MRVIEELSDIFGVGERTAIEWYNRGIRSLEQLYREVPLTHAQQVGIWYRKHFKERIPRAEMDLLRNVITNALAPMNIKFEILGSYRRGEPTSGDVDVAAEDVSIAQVLDLLRRYGYIVADLAQGPAKYMGVIQLPNHIARRIDIRNVSPEQWPYMVLYNTGSQNFNILMRNRAIEMGLRLSEHGLEDTTGQGRIFPAKTEEEIFRYLGLRYLPPNERRQDIQTLPLA